MKINIAVVETNHGFMAFTEDLDEHLMSYTGKTRENAVNMLVSVIYNELSVRDRIRKLSITEGLQFNIVNTSIKSGT